MDARGGYLVTWRYYVAPQEFNAVIGRRYDGP